MMSVSQVSPRQSVSLNCAGPQALRHYNDIRLHLQCDHRPHVLLPRPEVPLTVFSSGGRARSNAYPIASLVAIFLNSPRRPVVK